MKSLQKYNSLVKHIPTAIASEADIAKAIDLIFQLQELQKEADAQMMAEVKELSDKLHAVKEKYNKIIEPVEKAVGEIRGKIKHYAQYVIDSGGIIEKKIEGEYARLTFVADNEITVVDKEQLIKAVAEGKYPTTLLDVKAGEVKKYVKATKQVPEGIEAKNSVYFIIKEK